MSVFSKIGSYFKESKEELQKVAWPTRQETVRSTLLVIGISLFVAIFLGFIDIALSYGVKALLKLNL